MISAQKVKGSNPFGRTKGYMKTIFKSNDFIEISWIKNILSSNNIEFFILDETMSTNEGNISAIPVRILVRQEYADKAINIIKNERKLL